MAIQSFIVKAIPDRNARTAAVQWHGVVTHVPSGERRSWRTLQEITDFIGERLEVEEGD